MHPTRMAANHEVGSSWLAVGLVQQLLEEDEDYDSWNNLRMMYKRAETLPAG